MKLRSVFFGTVVSIAAITFVLVLMAICSYFTGISDSVSNICVYIGAALSVFAGSFCAARSCENRILLNSMSVSLFCIILAVIISITTNGRVNFNMHFLAVVLGSIFSGFLGAVLGK